MGEGGARIGREIMADAQKALHGADVVLGPADDGGYYLIAMCEPYDVFSGIPMSTSVVRRVTIELATRRGLKVRLLRLLFDIDELPDLLLLEELLHTERTLPSATAVHLARI